MHTNYPFYQLLKLLLTQLSILLLFPAVMAAAQNSDIVYDSYAGDYEITPTFIVSVTVEDGKLYAQASGQKKYALVSTGEHGFDYEGSDQSLLFVVDNSGSVNEIQQRADRFTRVAKRIAPALHVTVQQFSQAVLSGDIEKVKALVAQGADVHGLDTSANIGGPNGRRPLNLAALNNDLDMIDTLLVLGADINMQNLSGFTPLHHAIEYDSFSAIKLLVEKGADLSIKNRNNLTPAEFASASGRSAAANALQEALANKP